MSSYDDQRPTDQLSALLTEAVSDVEPADRLDEIRARVADRPDHRRTWWLAGGGAALAVAATVAAVALTSTPQSTADRGPQPIGSASPTPTAPSSPTEPSSSQSPGGTDEKETRPVRVYYVGDTPSGPRLFRDEQASADPDPLMAALDALTASPTDPDYRTDWPEGSFSGAGFDGIGDQGSFSVTLGEASLTERPDGMSEPEARAAVQAVVYSLNLAAGGGAAPVTFYVDNQPADTVLGVPAERDPQHGGVREFPAAPVLDTLSRVNLLAPAEGESVDDGTLQVRGLANSFEANVPWVLQDLEGNDVDQGSFAASGYMDLKLFPFKGSVDVSSLENGTYTLIVYTDDPSGGAEGPGADSDSRVVVIE